MTGTEIIGEYMDHLRPGQCDAWFPLYYQGSVSGSLRCIINVQSTDCVTLQVSAYRDATPVFASTVSSGITSVIASTVVPSDFAKMATDVIPLHVTKEVELGIQPSGSSLGTFLFDVCYVY